MAGVPGVLAVQGDFDKHLESLMRIGRPGVEVRTPDDLERVERLIIPGGESTTVGLLLERYGLGDAIRSRASEGMPIWGTCMGLILMAGRIEDHPDQYCLGLLDVSVRRNAYGAQVHSFEAPVPVVGFDEPILGVFIRAPVVLELGPGVETLAEFEGKVVAVRQGNRVGTSFHPELTTDDRFHRWFMDL